MFDLCDVRADVVMWFGRCGAQILFQLMETLTCYVFICLFIVLPFTGVLRAMVITSTFEPLAALRSCSHNAKLDIQIAMLR